MLKLNKVVDINIAEVEGKKELKEKIIKYVKETEEKITKKGQPFFYFKIIKLCMYKFRFLCYN